MPRSEHGTSSVGIGGKAGTPSFPVVWIAWAKWRSQQGRNGGDGPGWSETGAANGNALAFDFVVSTLCLPSRCSSGHPAALWGQGPGRWLAAVR